MAGPETNLIIEKLVYGGDGLARLDGRVVLVPFVLPGETVRVETVRERPGLLEARLLEVLAPAPDRIPPPCPHFARCGGCQYQHVAGEAQLRHKQAILRDVFRRVGKLDLPEEIQVISAEPWGYRNRTQFHFARGAAGYFEHGSHRLCSVAQCPLCSPRLNETLGILREMMTERQFPSFIRSIELFTNEAEVQINVLALDEGRHLARRFFDWCAERISGAATSSLEYSAAGHRFRVGHGSFFQVNRFLVDRMVECALDGAEGETALDLYAGVGLFTLPLAGRFTNVTAVESGASAVRDLEHNVGQARALSPVAIQRASVDAFLETREKPPDFVLADPPRAGLGKRVVKDLLRLRPPRLTVVSCDPSTLARDLAPLLAGGYAVERFTLVDLFPQTGHLETIASLRRCS